MSSDKIQLSDHFTYKRLLRFALPSVVMMLFTSVYGVVDGYFVSNFVGKTSFAAVNLIMPFLMICGAVGFMIGTGGSALVAKTLGESNHEKAKNLFSLLIYITLILGTVIAVCAAVWIRPIAVLLGAEGEMIDACASYGRIVALATPAFMLLNTFQSFLVTAERPGLGLAVTVAAGVTNMILDFVLVGLLPFGLVGAASATAASQLVGAVIPFVYFVLPNNSLLRLGKATFDGKALLKVCLNGSSEFVSNISLSVVGMLYNFRLLAVAGEDGIAAYGVLMYISFIFIAVIIGYTIGVSPVIGFHYGAGNRQELAGLFRKSYTVMLITGVSLTLLGEALAVPFSRLYVGYNESLCDMTVHAFILYSLSYLFVGFNILGSAFFTSLNDGFVSAVISFARLFLFQALSVMLLPTLLPDSMKLDGIWLATLVAELLSLAVTVAFILAKRKKYGYLDKIQPI